MNQDEKAARMEQHLLKTRFPKECKELPLDALTPEELNVVNKCMFYQDLTDEEFQLLKKTLQKYREAITKYKPNETIEAIDNTVQIIKTEQELLDILDSPEMRKLLVHLPINGNIYEFEFEILPLDNSRAIKGISMQLDLFKDFSKEETQIYAKAQAGQVISPEEKAILDRMNEEIANRTNEKQEEIIVTLLANQLKLPNSNQDVDARKVFWEKFPFNAKVSIFMKVEEKLGLTEYSNEKLFPVSK